MDGSVDGWLRGRYFQDISYFDGFSPFVLRDEQTRTTSFRSTVGAMAPPTVLNGGGLYYIVVSPYLDGPYGPQRLQSFNFIGGFGTGEGESGWQKVVRAFVLLLNLSIPFFFSY